MKSTDVVLALDPGKDHFAWSIIDGTGRLLDTGMIRQPVKEFKFMFFRRHALSYVKEIRELLSRHQYFAVVAERYQIRGMGSVGEVCEFVNLMLGIVTAEVLRMPSPAPHLDFMPAGVWKNWLSTVMLGDPGLLEKTPDAFGYPFVTKQASTRKVRGVLPIKEHQFDSIGIGLWFVAREAHVLDAYDMVANVTKPDVDRLWEERLQHG